MNMNADHIRTLLNVSRLTREAFARELGVNPSTVYRWLQGRPIPGPMQRLIRRVAEEQGVKL